MNRSFTIRRADPKLRMFHDLSPRRVPSVRRKFQCHSPPRNVLNSSGMTCRQSPEVGQTLSCSSREKRKEASFLDLCDEGFRPISWAGGSRLRPPHLGQVPPSSAPSIVTIPFHPNRRRTWHSYISCGWDGEIRQRLESFFAPSLLVTAKGVP